MLVAPLAPLAAGLVVGIVLDRAFTPPVALHGLLLVLSLSTMLPRALRRRGAAANLFLVSVAVGGWIHWGAARWVARDAIACFAASEGRIARVRGRVLDEPELREPRDHPFAAWTPRTDRTAFTFAADAIESTEGWATISGQVRVLVFEPILDLRLGERVELFGQLFSLRPPDNPGEFDWSDYHRSFGTSARMVCKHRENVHLLPAPGAMNATPLRAWLRRTLSRLLTCDIASDDADAASLLDAMVLGQRSRLSDRLNDVFIRSGCIHLVAVSGAHLVIVMFLAALACRPMVSDYRIRTLIAASAVVGYTFLVEPRPSVLRSCVVALTYCAARLIGGSRANLNWIAASVVVVVIVNPCSVFDVGAQLSFAAVLGVVFLSPVVRRFALRLGPALARTVLAHPLSADDRRIVRTLRAIRRPGVHALARFSAWIARETRRGLAIGIGAWLASMPIIAVSFHRLQPWGAVNSLLLAPLVTLVMALSLIKMIVELISPGLAGVVGAGLHVVESGMISFVEYLAELPGASIALAPPPWWWTVPYYALLLVLSLTYGRRPRETVDADGLGGRPRSQPVRPRRRLPLPASLAAILGAATLAWLIRIPAGRLTITMLSVGPGLAMVIELPDGRTALYDAGSSYDSDVARTTIVPFLRQRGIRHLERAYVSHANLDHFSGLPTLLDEIPCGPVVLNRFFVSDARPGSPTRRLVDILADRNHPTITIDNSTQRWAAGNVDFEVLWPADAVEGLKANDASTVLRLTYRGRRVLLTGDMEDAAQRALIDRADLKADVLLAPHHGSVRNSTRRFVEAVAPSVVLRSSDERTSETFNGFRELTSGMSVFNTADVGAVQVVIDGDGVQVKSIRPP